MRIPKPIPINEQAWPEGTVPTVSILCTTYNQSAYLTEAVEGFLRQSTSFPVEILIHDDASTDGTQHIASDFAARHPTLIRTILQKENQYSHGGRAHQLLMPMSKGKYFALCEGDDYWTASDKLETQVALLDANPLASGCIHRADGRFEQSNETREGFYGPDEVKPQYGLDDLLAGENFVPTASLVARSNLFNPPPSWLAEAPHNDLVFLTMAALSGPLLYVDRSMSVYRKHAGGIHTSDSTAIQQLKCIQTLVAIGDHFDLGSAPALRDGLRYRLRLINDEVRQYENKIRSLEQQHRIDREAMQQTMDSTTFKLGRILSTLRDRLSPSHREVKRGSRSL